MEGKGQQGAAAASGMSVRTARTWQRGRLPSEKKGKRRWRTRGKEEVYEAADPFAGVWAEEVEPLLRSDVEGALMSGRRRLFWSGSTSGIPAGSVCRSCGRYSVVFVTGERCPGRTERCSSSRSIRPVARLRWTSLTAASSG